METIRFILKDEQIRHLRKHYAEVPIVQKAFANNKRDLFKISEKDYVEFWDWLDDQSVFTMDEDYEPTEETYLFEDMIDFMSAQEKAPETYTPIYDEIDKQ